MARLVSTAWPIGSRPSPSPQCIGGGSRDRQQRRPPQEQANGRLLLRRRLPARPLCGQV